MIFEFSILDKVVEGKRITKPFSVLHEEIRYWRPSREGGTIIYLFAPGDKFDVEENYDTVKKMMEYALEQTTYTAKDLVKPDATDIADDNKTLDFDNTSPTELGKGVDLEEKKEQEVNVFNIEIE